MSGKLIKVFEIKIMNLKTLSLKLTSIFVNLFGDPFIC